jgi:hypothetical protein
MICRGLPNHSGAITGTDRGGALVAESLPDGRGLTAGTTSTGVIDPLVMPMHLRAHAGWRAKKVSWRASLRVLPCTHRWVSQHDPSMQGR